MSEIGYPEAMRDPKRPGMVDRLASEATRLHEEIELLSQKLMNVREMTPEVARDQVQPEPAGSRLHEVLLTLEHANRRLHSLAGELNL